MLYDGIREHSNRIMMCIKEQSLLLFSTNNPAPILFIFFSLLTLMLQIPKRDLVVVASPTNIPSRRRYKVDNLRKKRVHYLFEDKTTEVRVIHQPRNFYLLKIVFDQYSQSVKVRMVLSSLPLCACPSVQRAW